MPSRERGHFSLWRISQAKIGVRGRCFPDVGRPCAADPMIRATLLKLYLYNKPSHRGTYPQPENKTNCATTISKRKRSFAGALPSFINLGP
jgi:hypothetical protein